MVISTMRQNVLTLCSCWNQLYTFRTLNIASFLALFAKMPHTTLVLAALPSNVISEGRGFAKHDAE